MILFDKKQTAEILGVSQKTLTRWVKSGCPIEENGKFNLKEVWGWRFGARSSDKVRDIGNLSIQEQKLIYERDLKKAQSELHDLKLKIEKQEYLPKDEVVKNIKESLNHFKRSCLNIENKLVSKLGQYFSPDLQRKMKTEINQVVVEALNNMSRGNFEEWA